MLELLGVALQAMWCQEPYLFIPLAPTLVAQVLKERPQDTQIHDQVDHEGAAARHEGPRCLA